MLQIDLSSQGKPSDSESDKERRKHLTQAISRLKEEIQQVDLQIELAQRELVASGELRANSENILIPL